MSRPQAYPTASPSAPLGFVMWCHRVVHAERLLGRDHSARHAAIGRMYAARGGRVYLPFTTSPASIAYQRATQRQPGYFNRRQRKHIRRRMAERAVNLNPDRKAAHAP